MSTDNLPERLRNEAPHFTTGIEAADEIERLRAALNDLMRTSSALLSDNKAEIERLQARLDEVTATLLLQVDDTLAKCAEIERLQAALGKIADIPNDPEWDGNASALIELAADSL